MMMMKKDKQEEGEKKNWHWKKGFTHAKNHHITNENENMPKTNRKNNYYIESMLNLKIGKWVDFEIIMEQQNIVESLMLINLRVKTTLRVRLFLIYSITKNFIN